MCAKSPVIGPVTPLRSSMPAIDALEKSIPSGIAHRISVSGRVTSPYERSIRPTIFAPAIPGPLGCSNGAASGSATSHAKRPARIFRSGLHCSVFAGSFARVIGIVVGPDPANVARSRAAHEDALRRRSAGRIPRAPVFPARQPALLLVRDLRENLANAHFATAKRRSAIEIKRWKVDAHSSCRALCGGGMRKQTAGLDRRCG